ncbi:MAG: SPOR domain-containing protein [Paenirhodobacter sp.]|uniref:SPOR domain-containing protein n=1 Tax=Paenirhodobacter sp. TaxID=1965326 RepID=UPI003D1380E0
MAVYNTRDGARYAQGEPEADTPAGLGATIAAPVSKGVRMAGAATSLALILGVVVWGYKLAVRDVSGVPIIRAMSGPARIAPEDPGGDLARHTGLAVNEVAGTGLAAPGPERVLLAPDPDGLDPDDAPMAALRPLPKVTAAAPETPAEAAPAARPVADLPRGAAASVSAEATPDDTASAAEEDGAAPVELAAVAPPATAPDAAVAAPPPGAIPASVPGVNRSPRPLARPAHDLEAAAVEQAVAASLAGPAAAAVIDVDPATLPKGTRVVQLGAFDSPELAKAEWEKVATRFEPLMEGKKRIVQKATSGGRDFWRLRVQGFDGVEDARRFCAALVAEGANCIPTLAK